MAIGALYATTAARWVLGGDNGELVAVGVSNGVAHPPGYPLYLLLIAASKALPGTSPAHRAALMTAVIGTAAAAALAWAARAWGASRATSTAVAALFATGPLAWILATHAEVFALNVLVAMLLVGTSSPKLAPPLGREELRALALGLLAGLGLSNHHSIVLLAPLGLYALVRATARSGARALGAAALGLVLGLSPYVDLAIRASEVAPWQGCSWGSPRGFSGVLRHFLRAEYGTFQLAISHARPEPLAQVAALGETLAADLLGAPLLLVVGLLAFWRTRDRARSRWDYAGHAALVASLVLAGPVFVARFNLPPHGLTAKITERFHLLPLALTSVLVAIAIDASLRAFVRSPRAPALAAAAVGVVAVARAALSYPAVREHHRPTTELYLRNVLTIVPERAIVLHTSDDLVGGFMYARCALDLRPDVDAITPVLLLNDWYPEQVSARLGFPVVRGRHVPGRAEPVLSARELLDQLVGTSRPVFLTEWFASGLDRSTPSYPIGPLVRVVADARDVPDPTTLAAMNEDVFAKMVIEPTLPEKGTWAGRRMLDYARPWRVLAGAFDAAGDRARADACRRRAQSLTPR